MEGEGRIGGMWGQQQPRVFCVGVQDMPPSQPARNARQCNARTPQCARSAPPAHLQDLPRHPGQLCEHHRAGGVEGKAHARCLRLQDGNLVGVGAVGLG